MRTASIPCSGRSRRRLPALAAAAAAAGAIAVLGAAPGARAATPVSVFPIPGDRVATENTQIVIRGVPTSQFGSISVTGSKSGPHTGVVKADSDGDGGSFIPSKPFVAGEQVTVTTGLAVIGGSGGTWHFTIETPARKVATRPLKTTTPVHNDIWRYRTMPGYKPAALKVLKRTKHAAPGDLFVATQVGPAQNGLELFNGAGRLLWYHPVPHGDNGTDFRTQTYDGKPVLTWWQGAITTSGTGRGEDEIYDSSYHRIASFHAGNGLSSDLHEFVLTSANTALVTAYQPVYWNASKIKHGSKHEIVYDAVAQEIDIKTGLVLFQWDSLDHVALGDSYSPVARHPGVPWDYFHINSIQKQSDGSFVISARNTSAVYHVNGQTGKVDWILGGKRSSFKLGKGVRFWYQHDARFHPDGSLTLFDDAGAPFRESQSRGLTISLNTAAKTASLVHAWTHRPALRCAAEGNVQRLSNGDDLVGFGQANNLTEFDPKGGVVFDAKFVGINASYRAYRERWTGRAPGHPGIFARVYGGRTSVTASYNGTTTTDKWRILGGSSPSKLRTVATYRKRYFETTMRLAHRERYVKVQALDAHGKVLGNSKVIKGA